MGLGYHLLPQSKEGHCDLVVDDGEWKIPEIIDKLKAQGIGVTSVSLKAGTLDDVFLKYAGNRLVDGDLTWRTTRAARVTARRHAQ